MATEKKHEGPALGIDLGTTYSCVGVWRNDRVEIIANDQGNRTTPSWVAFTETDRLVGEAALYQSHRNPHNTIFASKRLIGRNYRDIHRGSLSYKVIAGPEERPQIVVKHQGEEKPFFPEDISGIVLSHMRTISEAFMGTTITKAVITVPAYFGDSQRRATQDAGRIAGLDVMRVINEPTAAAIAYQLEKSPSEITRLRTVLVFDLGGGTFDVTILMAEGSRLEVKATAGDTFLGGDDFDNRMVTYLVGEIWKKHNVHLSDNQKSLRRLRSACERAKRVLSSSSETTIEILHDGSDLEWKFTRVKFEEINKELFQTCMDMVKRCMKDAGLEASEIDEVVLVGGSSRIPKVQQMLQELCKGKELCKSINPDEAVAYGATVLSTFLVGGGNQRVKDLTLVDVTPLSLGTSVHGGAMSVVIPRNTPIPVKLSSSFVPALDNQTAIDFDIHEGERSMVVDNNFLGEFTLKGLPPNKCCDEVKINVVFELDANGILFVSAEDLDSGIRNETTILSDKRKLSSQEIGRMIREGISHRLEDEKCKKKAISKSKLENFLENATFRLENKNVTAERKSTMRKELTEMSSWLKENQDAEEIEYKEKKRKLEDSWDLFIGIKKSVPGTSSLGSRNVFRGVSGEIEGFGSLYDGTFEEDFAFDYTHPWRNRSFW